MTALLIEPDRKAIEIRQDDGRLHLVGTWPTHTLISDEVILTSPFIRRSGESVIIRLNQTAARYRVTHHDERRREYHATLEAWV